MKIIFGRINFNFNAVLFYVLLILTVFSSCKHDVPQPSVTNPCDPGTIYFENQIMPILRSNCAMDGCHSNSSAIDGINLSSYQAVMASGIVSPGDPDDSDLYKVLTDSDPYERMPPSGSLPAEQIQLIRTWITQGAKDLQCDDSTACDTSNVTWAQSIQPIIMMNCEGCHSPPVPQGGVLLDSYAAVRSLALNGKLEGVVEQLPGFSPMPKGGKLADCDISKIRIWVDAGAPNN